MQLSANELAKLVNGSVEGDPEVFIDRPSRIEEGGEGSISFLGNDKYEDFVYSTTASALLVSRDFRPRQPVRPTLIRVDHVYLAVAQLLEHFSKSNGAPRGISPNAFIHPSARIGQDVAVGAFAVIEADAEIGDGSVIFPQAYIGTNVRLGRGVSVYPGARILHDCKVGDRCTIHSNAVIGSDGFGFASDSNGRYQKIPQTGNVILHDEVDIGAGTTIDRASIGSTVIHTGVKLDNLIQVGHNVEIGRNTVVAAQTGIAGSTKIGANCQIGGQVGFAGHIRVPDGTRVQGQSGIASSIEEPGQAFFGYPAIPYHDYIKSYAVFKKLPELYKRIYALEKQIKGDNRQEG